MDPLKLIDKYYAPYPLARRLLLEHSRAVAARALGIARRLGPHGPDLGFIEEAAMLHDIGIFLTDAPWLGCRGPHRYIRHGVLGAELLRGEGFHAHALVCERHVGVGLTAEDVRRMGFPLPELDMVPVSLEEQVVCYSDKFFSKDGGPSEEKSLEKVRAQIKEYGEEKLRIFDRWMELFGV